MFFRKKNLHVETKEKRKKVEFSTFGFNDILHYIKRETGVDLFVKKEIIETRIKLFCTQKEINSFKQLYDRVKFEDSLKQELINLLTVNETYFFREENQLQEAINFAASKSGEVSILCAPCASGEEVYTLSIMMNEQLDSLKKFTITGIDINSEAIEKANNGVYSKRSLHKLSGELKEKYFSSDGDMHRIKKHLFSSVEFSKVNIFEDSFVGMGNFDIIFSRNMLIYFDDDFRVAALKRFSKLLKDDGRVFLGHADFVPSNEWLFKHGFGSSCYYAKPSH